MKLVVYILFFVPFLFGENYILQKKANLYFENVKHINTTNNISTFYLDLDFKYFLENDFDFNLKTETNKIIFKKDELGIYGNYIDKINLKEFLILKTMKSSSVLIGRSEIDFLLLNGSFDGAIFLVARDFGTVRFFYFNNYQKISSGYFEETKNIDIKGLSSTFSYENIETKFIIFNDYLGDYPGANVNLDLGEKYGLKFSKTYFNYGDEDLAKISLTKDLDFLMIESGVSKNFNKKVEHLLKYNNENINQFYLSGYLYLKKSTSAFINLGVFYEDLYFKSVFGITEYENSGYKNLYSKDFECYVLKKLEDDLTIKAGFLSSKKDHIDLENEDVDYFYLDSEYKF